MPLESIDLLSLFGSGGVAVYLEKKNPSRGLTFPFLIISPECLRKMISFTLIFVCPLRKARELLRSITILSWNRGELSVKLWRKLGQSGRFDVSLSLPPYLPLPPSLSPSPSLSFSLAFFGSLSSASFAVISQITDTQVIFYRAINASAIPDGNHGLL